MVYLMWDSFQKSSHNFEGSSEDEGMAAQVLTSFGINHSVTGGTLKGVNIKNADPLSVIKASLLEEFIYGNLKEIRVTSKGKVVEYTVGRNHSSLNIYYSTRSSAYVSNNIGVRVTGGKPRARRKDMGWKNVIGDGNSTIHDATNMASSCISSTLSSVVIITYKDPILTSGKSSFKDGIPNLFELESPWESIIGFAWDIDPGETNEYTTIKQSSTSTIPVLVSGIDKNEYKADIGELVERTIITGDDCFIEADSGTGGSPIQISLAHLSEGIVYKQYGDTEVNTFIGINGVYLVGVGLYRCSALPKDLAAVTENTVANSRVVVGSENMTDTIYRLSESEEYTIDCRDAVGTNVAKLQFAKNTLENDNGTYGNDAEFIVQSTSTDLKSKFPDMEGRATLLPTKNSGGGLMVKQVWAEVELDSPCFVITDPRGDAKTIAANFRASITALVVVEEPTPIAINGKLIDQSDSMADNDPTTAQNFEETALEKALTEMKGRTISVSMPSLTAAEVTVLSKNLYNLLKDDNTVYTHICAPSSSPEVGASGRKGGVVNKIVYSYQDQGSYLITVTEGPVSSGDFVGVSGEMYRKRTEEIRAVGTVLQHDGSHVYFKVNIDGFGPVVALNAYPGVIDIKDRVSVTVYNNPVEA